MTLASYSDKITLAEYRALTSIPFAHPSLEFMEELLCLLCRRFCRLFAHKLFEIGLLLWPELIDPHKSGPT